MSFCALGPQHPLKHGFGGFKIAEQISANLAVHYLHFSLAVVHDL